MAKQNTWIGEAEASQLLGLMPQTIKIYIAAKKLPVRRKAIYKAKSAFHLQDIQTYLSLKQIPQ